MSQNWKNFLYFLGVHSFLVLLLLCCCIGNIESSMAKENDVYHVYEIFNGFEVKNSLRESIGMIARRMMTLNNEFDFYDKSGEVIGSLTSEFLSFGGQYTLFDGNKNEIGKVKRQSFSFPAKFELISNTKLIAYGESNLLGTQYSILDLKKDRVIASMALQIFERRNHWVIQIEDMEIFQQLRIDPKLFYTIIIMQHPKRKLRRLKVG